MATNQATNPTIKVKARTFFVTNASATGLIIHGDPAAHALPEAQEPTIDLRDYKRLLNEGWIEPSDDYDEGDGGLADGNRPVGSPVDMLRALGVTPELAMEALKAIAGSAAAAPAMKGVTPLMSRDTTAHSQDTGKIHGEVPQELLDQEDDPETPPAGAQPKRGPGRPPKAAPVVEQGADGAPAGDKPGADPKSDGAAS